MDKIFIIGMAKTGTTSLQTALEILGVKCFNDPSLEELDNIVSCYDCIRGLVVSTNFIYLDNQYPNSKFIYTQRDKQSWLISIEQHLKKNKIEHISPIYKQNRMLAYSRLDFDDTVFSDVYEKNANSVDKYFKNKQNKLLMMDIFNGDGWNKLIKFLDFDVNHPIVPFPHRNKRTPSC